MLCIAIADKNIETIKAQLKEAEMAEIRIESCRLNKETTAEVFKLHKNLIATCRPEGVTDAQRMELLKVAIDNGAAWVDIEIESDRAFTNELAAYAKAKGCKVIISYHDYNKTPSVIELNKIVDNSIEMGAELVKMATMVITEKDNAALISMYNHNVPMLALGMGQLGTITRIGALKFGAPFTFVSGDNIEQTAPGQLKISVVKNILSNL